MKSPASALEGGYDPDTDYTDPSRGPDEDWLEFFNAMQRILEKGYVPNSDIARAIVNGITNPGYRAEAQKLLGMQEERNEW